MEEQQRKKVNIQSVVEDTLDLQNLPADPGERKKISEYMPNDRDNVRRAYLQRESCQPRNHNFPSKLVGGVLRRFPTSWYDDYGNWIEYSIKKDAVFCLCCYLFGSANQTRGGCSFESGGFSNWHKKDRLVMHIGGANSMHNNSVSKCDALMNQRQHIAVAFSKHSDEVRRSYRARLTASIDCVRFLLKQGLAFRGHNERNCSINQGNFLELLKLIADHNDVVNKVVLENAPQNLRLTSPEIQKDIAHAAACEVTNTIIEDIQDGFFALLVDESRDVSNKEQMAIVLRYVNGKGNIVESFLGIVHVRDTTSLSLKLAIDDFLARFSLSTSRIRGQGYDGASNMRGELNGLKSLILRENPSAFYIHCFSHQLQLALVYVAKTHIDIATLFNLIAHLINVVGGRGLNQERGLSRPCDTRWGTHYGTLLNLTNIFSSIVGVLKIIVEDGVSPDQRAEANTLSGMICSFEFAFTSHLMKSVLGITHELSEALQRNDQDIVNAMSLVKISKELLQKLRDTGWDSLLLKVSLFCQQHDIDIPSMDDECIPLGRSKRTAPKETNDHHFRVGLFYTVIDAQLQELNNRFNEVNTELLLCVSCLSPNETFSSFDKMKLIRLSQIYSLDFSHIEVDALDNQLETYIIDMRSNDQFSNLKGAQDLAMKLVETKKNIVYPLVYRLVKFALILPVSTANVERVFSAMKIVKNRLRNRIGDQWTNDCLVTFIEKEIFHQIDKEKIIQRFQHMKSRRGQL